MFKFIFPVFSLLFMSCKCGFQWVCCMVVFSLTCVMVIFFVAQPCSAVFSSCESMSYMISAPLIILTFWVSFLMVAASYKVWHTRESCYSFMATVVSLSVALVWCFSGNSLAMFYIAFESSLIPTLVLIIGWGYQPERLQAGIYMMLYTISASLPLLFGVGGVFFCCLSTSFVVPVLSAWDGGIGGVWWVCLVFAFLVKMPVYLVHLWLPKAHVEAPIAGSMVLAGILLKLGGYGLMQVMIMFPCKSFFISSMIVSVSMWGALSTSMICLRQTDMKSLIAYSSVGHMGVLVGGIMSDTSWGWGGAMVMMVAHGVCSPAMFALANMTYEITGTRSLSLSKGLLCVFPSFSFWWFIMSAANMAAPPTINLAGEVMLYVGVMAHYSGLAVILGVSSFLVGAYSLFLYTSCQHGVSPNFFSPTHMFSSRNYSVLFFHSVPVFFMAFKLGAVYLQKALS